MKGSLGPIFSHVTGEQKKPRGTTRIRKHVMEKMGGGRHRREQCVHCEERQNWRCKGGEDLPDEGRLHRHLRSQPILSLKTTSGFMATQQQGFILMSLTHITNIFVHIPSLGCFLEPS